MNVTQKIRIGAVADSHYGPPAIMGQRRSELALELLTEAVRRFNDEIRPDVVVILGDLVDFLPEDEPPVNLEEIREVLEPLWCPCIAVPGNHDGPPGPFQKVFGPFPRRLDVAGCSLLCFQDTYSEGDVATRQDEQIAWTKNQSEPLLPLRVALQHNPIWPDIEDEYPYIPRNRETIIESYRQAGIHLSLSGHFHPGVEPVKTDGVWYATVPALCEEPFPFVWVDVTDAGIEWRRETVERVRRD
jgi:3',5'-cyclic AMP phosphodiesterase CpdA